jgi:hypothetical protein
MSESESWKTERAKVTPRARPAHRLKEKTIRVPSLPCGRAYVYKPIPKGYIRLLTIKSSHTQSSIYHLDTYPQVHAPEYDAVSYCWGEDATLTAINCDGFDLTLRYSLFIALQYLTRRSRPRRPLWIDAISLNQDDDNEKAIQVPLMHEIYKRATRTVVWLGEPDGDTDVALSFMAEAASYLEKDGDPRAINRFRRVREWKALREYLSRPWFNRLWALQEVVLSQDIEILCHSHDYKTISWQHLLEFIAILREGDLHLSLLEVEGVLSVVHNLEGLEDWRLRLGEQGYLDVTGLLSLGRDRLCHEPIDRIWALLGLLRPELVATIQRANIIDYSEPGKRDYWKTYLAVMKLLHAEDIFAFILLVLRNYASSRHSSLPSWCPDFNMARLDDTIRYGRKFRSGYSGGEGSELAITELDPTSDALCITGFNIGEVRTVTSLAPGPEMDWLPWLKQCEKLTLGISRESQEAAEALAETLVLADDRTRKQYPEPWDPHYQCLRGKYEATDPYDYECPHGEEEKHGSYRADARVVCKGKRFFTANDGRIGLASSDVRVGDKICVFIGIEALFVLRGTQHDTVKADKGQQADHEPRPESSQETFKLIGDAYVHGMMFGEAFTAEGRGPERKFKIF